MGVPDAEPFQRSQQRIVWNRHMVRRLGMVFYWFCLVIGVMLAVFHVFNGKLSFSGNVTAAIGNFAVFFLVGFVFRFVFSGPLRK